MAPTEPVRLDPGLIRGCLALSAEAGWNQTAEDWSVFFGSGAVYGVLGPDGEPVASGAALPYPGGFGWISMVLVMAARRRERLGTRILEACIEDHAGRGSVPCLDATPAGERVYRPLGFEPVFGLARWQGTVPAGSVERATEVRAMTERDLPVVRGIDAEVFGAERGFLLDGLYLRARDLAFMTADGRGFVLARAGRLATQIGPLAAPDEPSAEALLRTALAAVRGPVFLDLADRWHGLPALLGRLGFSIQRPFLRMALGRSHPFGDATRLFLAAGPEFG